MNDHTFYRNNKMSITLEEIIKKFNSFEEFEHEFSDEFLNLDNQIGYCTNMIKRLLWFR